VARIVCIIIFSFNCAPPVDYFGNNVDLSSERIYLTRLRNDDKNKDKYILVFNEQRGNPTKLTETKKHNTLIRYINLIMGYYGYTDYNIINERVQGIIEPRYYVTLIFQ
tara:strand:- start:679 stop:1005 length:327 start_codon:yes stop_codon:yes gene_type:complete